MAPSASQSDRAWERERDRNVDAHVDGRESGRESGRANGRDREREQEREQQREPESAPQQPLQPVQPVEQPVQSFAPPTGVNREVYGENGRYYGTFRRGKYMFPIDAAEMDKMDIQHKFFMLVRSNRCITSPLNTNEPRVMDLGTGTGIWAIDMAEQYPAGVMIGIDLNLIQPEFIPPNVQFLQRDIEVPWVDMNPGTWDIIHMRAIHGSISNWPRLYSEIFRHLKPRTGHMEQVEIDWTPRCDDNTLPANAAIRHWSNQLLNAMDGFGRPLRINVDLTKRRLAEAGFVDIKEETIPFPINGWPEDKESRVIGRWFNLAFLQGLEALSLAPLFRGHNTPPGEIRALLEDVNKDCRAAKMHTYMRLHVFTARKP